jgi:Flp pilus assembly protein TadG
MRHHDSRLHAHRREHGAAAVEFGLVLLPLMTLLLGLLQYGWYFYASQSASAAAREGARRVIVGDCWDPAAELTPYVQAQAPMATTASYTPTDLSVDTVLVGDLVTVTVEADGNIIGFLPLPNDGAIEQEFQARLEDKTAKPCA